MLNRFSISLAPKWTHITVLSALLMSVWMFSSSSYANDDLLDESDEIELNDIQAEEVFNEQDPYEKYNRVIFRFNTGFDQYVGQPLASVYLNYVPTELKIGINNFLNNVATPIYSVNHFLQGKTEGGLKQVMRFSVNSTIGLFGLIDVASPMGLESQKEDFGQTLFHWGVWEKSSYVVVPILGPYTTRSLIGSGVDTAIDPVYRGLDYAGDTGNKTRTMLFVSDKFVTYANASSLIEELYQQPDPYVFARESYLQNRLNLIYDGRPPEPDLDDFNFE